MAASLQGSIGADNATTQSSEGAVTIEGDTINVSPSNQAVPGTAIVQSPKNFLPILLVIALIAAIWYYMKRKGQI